MKLFVLAASIGYVLGVAVDEDCGTLTQGDQTCDAGTFCDVSRTATGDGTNPEDDGTSGKCTARLANGDDCSAAPSTCIETDYCKANVCATLEVADADCTAGGDCAGGVCEGPCGASLTCGANANADGAIDGCCSNDVAVTDDTNNYCSGGTVTAKIADGDGSNTCVADGDCVSGACQGPCGATLTCGANTNADGAIDGCCSSSVVVTDTDANYCSGDPGTVTQKIADGEACEDANDAWCASGTCTATVEGETAGTCDVTVTEAPTPDVGADGGACRTGDAIVTGSDEVTACGDGLTCDSTSVWCQTTGTTEPGAADSTAAAGALGGACTADAVTAVGACDADLECADSVCGAAATDAPTDAPSDGGEDDGSPAVIFYGLSMVTGAIAYLL